MLAAMYMSWRRWINVCIHGGETKQTTQVLIPQPLARSTSSRCSPVTTGYSYVPIPASHSTVSNDFLFLHHPAVILLPKRNSSPNVQAAPDRYMQRNPRQRIRIQRR